MGMFDEFKKGWNEGAGPNESWKFDIPGETASNRENVFAKRRTEVAGQPVEPTQRQWKNVDLRPGEEVIEEFYPSALWPVLIAAFFLLPIPPAILIVCPIIYWWIKQNAYAVTTDRFITRTGAFFKSTNTLPHSRITDVQVYRPLMAGLWRNGRVMINTAGRGGTEVVVRGQADPDRLASTLNKFA